MAGTDRTDDVEVALAIERHGHGRPMVFTHGWADTRAVWSGVVEHLADELCCVTWDLRGHGESSVPPAGQYSRAHALDDLDRVVGTVDGPAVLVGHSLGGYLSLAYALTAPERVAGLVLVASGPGFRRPEAMERWNESVRRSAAKLGVPEGQEEISLHVDSWVIDHLGDITCPVVTVIGERDERFAAAVEVFGRALDVRAAVTVPDAGHMVHLKHPAETAEAVRLLVAEL